ncbi:MAG: hypothetical protein JSV85_07890 [Candidatus Bathyarchaeota archaeon]|nr:MAG: hypothetical protein JSV85_07890 [Candidatus Bathyarchaeota archaeon]
MVEEYVKDLYRIGLILFAVPVVLILLAIALAILGQPVDFELFNSVLGVSSLVISGLLIMLYLSIKYYYKEGRYGKS